MDNDSLAALSQGALRWAVSLTPDQLQRFGWLGDELVRWNAKVNLTAVTAPAEVVEKHFVDSLAVVPHLGVARTVLDIGSGAGFPGLPLKLARPELEVCMVDAVAKKVGFIKHVIAQLQLAPGAKAVHARVEGRPEAEGLAQADLVVSRAFTDLGRWLPAALPYVAEGGRIVSMLGRSPGDAQADALAAANGLRLEQLVEYALPFSGDPRALAVFRRR